MHGDGISFWAFMVLLMQTGYMSYHLHELPVFEPNDYFWKNHWDGKEEKWFAYARAV